ncbi:unnamed protein product [Cuscuta campestris]|uniref:Heme-binding protein 2 n=2 Tax=Cuscuta sect. Cleistogrammica TaxID=1824901 RepID=A0A484K7X2_9ASTE|nr:hypothetical protein DM860_017452 [Cuscuta australis]VFQ62061.1 unnamed protein product [Cuscuta campestris]
MLIFISYFICWFIGTAIAAVPGKSHLELGVLPPTCERIECPIYYRIASGKDYEIRRYSSAVWMSTSPINGTSFVDATRTGFLRLFGYISGNNSYHKKIEMTAPVMTEVKPSDGPFCNSSFVVSFSVPKANQQDPPQAESMHLQRWGKTYVAVRRFGGFVSDMNVGKEAEALSASLNGTEWLDAIKKSHAGENTTLYAVAQYNSPFEFLGRVNEIWLMFFDQKDQSLTAA